MTIQGEFGTVVRQVIAYDIIIVWYYIVNLERDYLLRLQVESDTFYLNLTLEGRTTLFYATQRLPIQVGRFHLLRVPAGSHDSLWEKGSYRMLQVQIRQDIVAALFPEKKFKGRWPIPIMEKVPTRFADVSVGIPVGATFQVNRILSNEQEGMKARILKESAAKEMMLLCFDLLHDYALTTKAVSRSQLERFEEVAVYIGNHLDIDITVPHLCEKFHISRTRLYDGFQRMYGESVHEYIISQRIEKAKLLLQEDKAVSQVAMMVGFNKTSSFIRAFKQKTGTTPAAFKLQ